MFRDIYGELNQDFTINFRSFLFLSRKHLIGPAFILQQDELKYKHKSHKQLQPQFHTRCSTYKCLCVCALLQMQQLETSMSACFIPHPTSFLFLSVPFICLFLFFLLSFANMAFSSCLLQHNIHTDNIKIINKYNKNINKRSLQRVHSASLGKANVFRTTKQSDHDSSNYKCFISQVFKKRCADLNFL